MKTTRFKKAALVFLCLILLIGSLLPVRAAAAGSDFCNMIVFVKFADDSADVFNAGSNVASLLKMYNDTGTSPDYSFKNYLRMISDGQFSVDNYMPQLDAAGAAIQTFMLSKAKSGYSNVQAIIDEVITAINSKTIPIDFSEHIPNTRDSDCLDNLTVIVQGSTDDRQDMIYPHKSVYNGMTTISSAVSGGTTDVYVRNYNLIDSHSLIPNIGETSYYGQKQGVITHEFLHTLGLPDLYRYSSDGVPVGIWSIMAAVGPFMQYPLTYSRASLGWLNIREITADGTYTLNNVMQSTGDRAIKLTTPMSTSEFFVVEYRKKIDNSINANIGFETKIPESGLVVYRVDTTIENQTNAAGDNYIYIFRPDATSADDGEDVSAAAITAADGGYGSTDLAAAYTANTIYYANGTNSGIQLSNLKFSADGESVTFDVDFADYTALDLWDNVGTMPIGESYGDASIALDASGAVCAAWTNESNEIIAKRYDGSAWSQLGKAVSSAFSPRLAAFDGQLYMLCMYTRSPDAALPTLYRLTDGAWTQLWQDGAATGSLSLFSGGSELYAAYVSDETTLVIRNARTGALINNTLTAGSLTNPALAYMNGGIYAAYSDYETGADHRTVVQRYDLGTRTWSEQTRFALTSSNSHALAAADGKLYLYAANGNSGNPIYSIYDGSTWSAAQTLTCINKTLGARLAVADGIPYIAYWNATDTVAKVVRKTSAGWSQFGSDVMTAASGMDFVLSDTAAYAVACDTSSVYVKTKSLSTTPVTPPVTQSFDVRVTPPSGYTDTSLWIDGVEYAAVASGGKLTAQAPDGTARTVAMYKYNASGVPVGMYVWTLAYANGAYVATAQPALTDLLTYHGFSVRVAGQSGIRFKTGISAALRDTLTSAAGADGFTLAEYGTVVMNSAYRANYPLVKGGQKTAFGRAYWKDGATVNDAIFETVDGRHRFTSVLIGIPVANYKTEFAFRGYVQLTKNGTSYTFYGPVVARSIYYVSQQVIASGQFAVGSAADVFLRGIVSAADAQ